jgi:hypothetical protein
MGFAFLGCGLEDETVKIGGERAGANPVDVWVRPVSSEGRRTLGRHDPFELML